MHEKQSKSDHELILRRGGRGEWEKNGCTVKRAGRG